MDISVVLQNFFQHLSDPAELIRIGGFVFILIIIYLETGFFLGLVLPGGDYLVFTAGLLCGTQYLEIPFGILLVTMIAAAILGDFTGYAKGRWLGPRLFAKEENKIFKRSHLDTTRRFYERYGMMAFVIGRYLPVVRTMIPILAGASKVAPGRFSLFNVAGAIAWIGVLMPAGYFIGKEYPWIMDYSIYLMLGFIVIASIPVVKFWFNSQSRNPQSPDS